MKLIKSLFFIIFFESALGADWNSCRTEGEMYGNGEGPSYISNDCINIARDVASTDHHATFVENDVVTYIRGYENMIIITAETTSGPLKPEFIAGSFTGINNVESLSFDNTSKEISVVDSVTGDTLIFDLSSKGNTAPKKTISSK